VHEDVLNQAGTFGAHRGAQSKTIVPAARTEKDSSRFIKMRNTRQGSAAPIGGEGLTLQ